MARNGSGTYSLLAVTAPANTVSSSTTVNNNMNDIATALTESINKDGTKAWAANQSVGSNKFTSLADGSARTDSINMGQVQDGKVNWVDGGGTADAITATYSPAITALVDGQICFVRATAANTSTTPTFAPNGLTARTIVKTGGVALVAGDIVGDGHELILRYLLASTRWELLNPGGLAILAAANTFTATQTIQSSDDGAAVGPILILDRASASPAASDLIGYIMFRGKDAGGNNVAYGEITTQINDTTDGSEDAEMLFGTVIAGANASRMYVGSGMYMAGATGSAQGAGTINAQEYYKNGLRATRHLISTITTTSGTTHSVTDIPAYRELYIEFGDVSFSANATMTLAVSGNNGSTYGTARPIAVASGSAGGVIFGTIRISNIQSSNTFAVAHSVSATAPTSTATVLSVVLANAASAGGAYDAIQFAGGTFDAGTIRVYGLL